MKQLNEHLTDEQKHVLFEKGTEAPFTDTRLTDFTDGVYRCVNCGAQLFTSDAKYESKTAGLIGWPSFDTAIEGAVRYREDASLGMYRTEVVCAACGVHLGHVFAADDAPSGNHFCVNSVCLNFNEDSRPMSKT